VKVGTAAGLRAQPDHGEATDEQRTAPVTETSQQTGPGLLPDTHTWRAIHAGKRARSPGALASGVPACHGIITTAEPESPRMELREEPNAPVRDDVRSLSPSVLQVEPMDRPWGWRSETRDLVSYFMHV
jgi:hypothetical protein